MAEASESPFIGKTGAWSIEGDFGARARWCLAQAQAKAEVAQAASRTSPSGPQPSERARLSAEAYLLADAATVFAAIAVETFINYYGVRVLGENLYREIERDRPSKKVRLLAKAALGKLLPKDHEILGVIQRLFDARNALAHPKTREVPQESAFSLPPPLEIERAEAAVAEMGRFFDLFAELDPAAEPTIRHLQQLSSLTSEWT